MMLIQIHGIASNKLWNKYNNKHSINFNPHIKEGSNVQFKKI